MPTLVGSRGRLAARVAVLCAIGLLCRPAAAGPPFRTDDPEPVEYQHWELNLLSTGTAVRGATTGVLPGVEVNYGAAPNLQLHIIAPLGYEATSGRAIGFAVGDVELGAKYRFIEPAEDDWFPQVATFPLIEVPLGNQKLGFSTGHMQVFLPIWLQKDFEPWTVYGGGGYWINPGFGNKDFWFYGVALWRSVGESLHLGVEVFHQTANVVGGKDSTGVNVGAVYDLSERWHVLSSVGTGLQNVSATNQFSYYAAIQLTF